MKFFVVVYDRHSGESTVEEFDGPDANRESIMRRLELEKVYQGQNIEVVALGSDSRASIEQTHARYFYTSLARAAGH